MPQGLPVIHAALLTLILTVCWPVRAGEPPTTSRTRADALVVEMSDLCGRLEPGDRRRTYEAAVAYSREQLTNALELVERTPASDEARAQLDQAFELATTTRDNLRRSVDSDASDSGAAR